MLGSPTLALVATLCVVASHTRSRSRSLPLGSAVSGSGGGGKGAGSTLAFARPMSGGLRAASTEVLRLRGGSRKNNRKHQAKKHKFHCQVDNTEIRDRAIKKKKRIDTLLMNKLAKDLNSTLTISWGSQPPEMSLIEAEGAGKLNQKIEGIHGNVIQLVKHDHRDRLVNGEVANQETGHMSYELTERAWRAAEKDYRLIGVPDIAKRRKRACHGARSSGKVKKNKARLKKMQARFDARQDPALPIIMTPGGLWRSDRAVGSGAGQGRPVHQRGTEDSEHVYGSEASL